MRLFICDSAKQCALFSRALAFGRSATRKQKSYLPILLLLSFVFFSPHYSFHSNVFRLLCILFGVFPFFEDFENILERKMVGRFVKTIKLK